MAEVSGFYYIVIPLTLLILYGVGKISNSIWFRPKSLERRLKQQGIRGTSYTPLIGDMKEFIRLIKEAWSKPISLTHQIVSRVDPFTLYIVEKYGNVSFFWAGKTPRLIIKDPDLMKEVLSNKLGHFSKPQLNPLILILTRGLTTLEGEEWARRRKMINHAFHIDKLKEMIPIFVTSCGNMIDEWNKMIGVEERLEVDIWQHLPQLTADVISRAAFSGNYGEGNKIFQLQKELLGYVVEAMQSLYIPGLRFVPTKKNQRRKKLDKDITSMIRAIIQRKKASIDAGHSDLLGHLLNQNLSAVDGVKEKSITLEEIIEECKQFYLAGQETTSSWLTWTIIVLAMHPEWQDKAREEVQHDHLDFEALSHFKIVTMILYEVLRLYPPVIALYLHAYKETKIGNFIIPAGVDVTLPTLLIHHDPGLWGDDAHEFKPERFSEGVSKASKDRLAFFPFGWGPRTCIGQTFAMLEAKVALVMILRNFSFELSPAYTHAPSTVITLQPQHGAQVILRKL